MAKKKANHLATTTKPRKARRITTRAKGLASTKPTPQKSTDWYPEFLNALVEYGVISYACQKAGINRATYYDRINTDKQFAEAVELAKEEAADGLEGACFDRAKNGTTTSFVDKSGRVHEMTQHHDTLAIFLLKGLRPQRYAKPEVLIQNNVQVNHMTMDQYEARLEERGLKNET
jgi:hypothetical protein